MQNELNNAPNFDFNMFFCEINFGIRRFLMINKKPYNVANVRREASIPLIGLEL